MIFDERIAQIQWDLKSSTLAIRSESGNIIALKGEFETAKKVEILKPEELEDIDLDDFDANDFEIPEELATPPDDVEVAKETVEEKGGKSPEKATPGHSQIPKFGDHVKEVPENPEE